MSLAVRKRHRGQSLGPCNFLLHASPLGPSRSVMSGHSLHGGALPALHAPRARGAVERRSSSERAAYCVAVHGYHSLRLAMRRIGEAARTLAPWASSGGARSGHSGMGPRRSRRSATMSMRLARVLED